MSARRGAGCLYQQRNRQGDKAGPWWIKYSVNGQARYESTGTPNKQEAQRLLNERLGRVAKGVPLPPRVDKILYDELAGDLREHYRTTKKRNLVEVDGRLSHLSPYFGGRRVVTIEPAGLTGLPQLSLPGATVDGLPVGLSILAARGSDAALVAVAKAMEASR